MSSLQPWQSGQPWKSMPGQANMRASHSDRERTVDVLKAAYAEGRLTADEYEQRMSRAYQSYTYGELTQLISDLPQGPVPMVQAPSVPPTFLPSLPPAPRPTNASSVGSLVCGIGGILGGFTSIPAVVLGHMAKTQIRQTGEDGDGLATAGLVFGYLGIVWWFFVYFLALVL